MIDIRSTSTRVCSLNEKNTPLIPGTKNPKQIPEMSQGLINNISKKKSPCKVSVKSDDATAFSET